MLLTDKQKEFIKEGNHRFNIKTGATRSGKTYLDIFYTIPQRIRERAGLPGLYVILGVTNSTIERNVLTPLRDLYGDKYVSTINNKNIAKIFGEKVYCLGAGKGASVSKIRGASIKYCYCDELAEYNPEIFELLKSRLDKPYSMMDATLNPEGTNHWLKQDFLDTVEEKGLDVYEQRYTIFDNPFLEPTFVENLCKEYEGTVYYNRYILGQWCNAEGLIYQRFADNPSKYKWTKMDDNGNYILTSGITVIGIDYGGNKSGQAFVCLRISNDFKTIIALGSEKHYGDIDPDKLFELEIGFAKKMEFKYNCHIDYMFPDNEEVVLIRGLRNGAPTRGINAIVRGCDKLTINDRIDCERTMIAYDMFYFIDGECDTLVEALCTALWDDEKMDDVRLDDLTTDIDTLDAFEYAFTKHIRQINDVVERTRKG